MATSLNKLLPPTPLSVYNLYCIYFTFYALLRTTLNIIAPVAFPHGKYNHYYSNYY